MPRGRTGCPRGKEDADLARGSNEFRMQLLTTKDTHTEDARSAPESPRGRTGRLAFPAASRRERRRAEAPGIGLLSCVEVLVSFFTIVTIETFVKQGNF